MSWERSRRAFLSAAAALLAGCASPRIALRPGFDFSRMERVAVLRLDGEGGAAAADLFAHALLEAGADVMERSRLEAVLAERATSPANVTEPSGDLSPSWTSPSVAGEGMPLPDAVGGRPASEGRWGLVPKLDISERSWGAAERGVSRGAVGGLSPVRPDSTTAGDSSSARRPAAMAGNSIRELGEVLGVDGLFMGSVMEYSPSRSYVLVSSSWPALSAAASVGAGSAFTRTAALGSPGTEIVTSSAKAALALRLVDVRSGAVVWSAHESYEGFDMDSALSAVTRELALSLRPLWRKK